MSTPNETQPSPRRILVTGGTGFIGSHTCVELLNAGYDVTIVDNLSNSSKKAVDRMEKITGKRLTFYLADLCNYDALDTIFAKDGPFHGVVHFSGLKAVGESCAVPLRYYDNNVSGTINLLRAMDKHECRNFVFSSSATVYGDPETIPVDEKSKLTSTNPYGRTKLFVEEICRDIAKGENGDKWRFALLRYFNPVGAHPSGLIGEDPEGIPNNLMPYIAQVAVGRRPHLNIFGDDYDTKDGTGVRDYIHVVDLAKGHVAALDNAIFAEMPTNCEVYNLGTGVGYSVKEMLNAMSDACGKKLKSVITPRRAGDIAIIYGNADKAKHELQWEAQLGIKDIVEDTWRWQSNNPNGYAS